MLARALAVLSSPRLLCLGFALRVLWLLLCPNTPTSDQRMYHDSATRLAAGLGYVGVEGAPVNFWPVGYPALLAPAYWLFGAEPATAYGVNVGLGLLGIAGIYVLGLELFDARTARLAALLVTIHPTFVLHTTLLASETPVAAGIPWILWSVVRLVRSDGGSAASRWAVASGAAIGLLTYVRPPMLLLLAVPPVFALLERRGVALAARGTIVVAACTFSVLAPWGLRNRAHFGELTLTSANGGVNLWMGNNPASDGGYFPLPAELQHLPPHKLDRQLRQEAVAFILANPGAYLRLTWNRVYYSLRSDTIAAVWNWRGIERRFGRPAVLVFQALCTVFHWALLASAAWLWIRRRDQLGRVDLELAFALAVLAAPFVLIVGGNRYMVPLLPVLALVSASNLRAQPADR